MLESEIKLISTGMTEIILPNQHKGIEFTLRMNGDMKEIKIIQDPLIPIIDHENDCDHLVGFFKRNAQEINNCILQKSEIDDEKKETPYLTCTYDFKFCPDCGDKLEE